MATRSKKKKKQQEQMKQTLRIELYGLVLLAFSIIALVQPGKFGELCRGLFRFFAGTWDFLIPLFILFFSIYIMWKRSWPTYWSVRWSGVLIICVSFLILAHLNLMKAVTANGRFEGQSVFSVTWNLYLEDISPDVSMVDLGGGMIGALFYGFLNFFFAEVGTIVVVVFLFLIGLMLLTGISYLNIIVALKKGASKLFNWLKEKKDDYKEMMREERERLEQLKEDNKGKKESEPQVIDHFDSSEQVDPLVHNTDTKSPLVKDESIEGDIKTINNTMQYKPLIHDFTEVAYKQGEQTSPTEKKEQGRDQEAEDALLPLASLDVPINTESMVAYKEEEKVDYKLPSYSLLKKPTKKQFGGKSDISNNARKLTQTLASFGVQAEVKQVHRGPAVTRYEVHPAVGVKVSRIVNLTDDIALALAAKGIRMEAPIPGKSAIGIEVPNEDVAIVTLREILESGKYDQSDSKLSIALGRDISGEPIVGQLNKMPHLLVAGATGSGKSVCINGIIASILYKAKPHEVKLMMIDPKMVELNVYNGIPHLLAPVVTEPRKASIALKKVVSEMERRYELFSQSGTRDIERYNELVRRENQVSPDAKKPLLPYIVVIVDELADLMMVAAGDVEDAICRLAQMARAAGIHLIIATQRPSVDVITGVIKANIPSRIAFGVSSQADSRTILDMGGAEKLLGRGDMLFLPVGSSKPLRIQGVFVEDDEIEDIVEHCIAQQKASYHQEMIPEESEEGTSVAEVEDELYQDAVQMVVQQGSASVSMLQRRFRVGYARAARLIDAMEENGIVGPYEGSKPREVLISKEDVNIS